MEDNLKDVIKIEKQEEQICKLLECFDKLFTSEKLYFFRYSPIGFVGEGIVEFERGQFRSISYLRDDIRSLLAVNKAVTYKRAFYYQGFDYITHISSRYFTERRVVGLLVVPLVMNDLTISYICSEYTLYNPNFTPEILEQFTTFGQLAAHILYPTSMRKGHPLLSPRETQVIQSIAYGLSTKEIAEFLSISETTVKQYIKTCLEKLEAKNRAHAVYLFLTTFS